jgi:hypothetical protein
MRPEQKKKKRKQKQDEETNDGNRRSGINDMPCGHT